MIEREFEGVDKFTLGKSYVDTTGNILSIEKWPVYQMGNPRFINVLVDLNPEPFNAMSDREHLERIKNAGDFIIDSGGFPV